ncbi:hypothetical protein BG58_40985 [Caballeronia jiangsuensis]|nr:hypothetical protein BG58_40985 [Caballeronia jiangsuensis]
MFDGSPGIPQLPASDAVHSGMSVSNALIASDISPLRIVAALVFCLLLGVAIIFLMRRWNIRGSAFMPRSTGQLRLLQTLRLDARATLHLIEYGNTQLLLGCGPEGITSLHTRSLAQEP